MFNPRSAAGSWRATRVCLGMLLLVIACAGEPPATGPSAADAQTGTQLLVNRSVFTVEPTVMNTPTYDGSGQSVHPDVVTFESNWHGARFWFTMTPYAKSNQALENPSILRSYDGIRLDVPPGVTNPIIKPPRREKD